MTNADSTLREPRKHLLAALDWTDATHWLSAPGFQTGPTWQLVGKLSLTTKEVKLKYVSEHFYMSNKPIKVSFIVWQEFLEVAKLHW